MSSIMFGFMFGLTVLGIAIWHDMTYGTRWREKIGLVLVGSFVAFLFLFGWYIVLA